MPFKIPPKFCPMFDPDIEVPAELADCKCLMTAGHLAEEGHSAFCLGQIREYTMEVQGVVHTNDYCFCVWSPTIEDGVFRVASHAINEDDMEWLHTLLHAALGLGKVEYVTSEEEQDAASVRPDLDR